MEMGRLQSRQTYVGAGFVFLAAAMWGLLGPVARVAFAEGLSPMEVAFWRAFLGSVFFGIHAGVRGGRFPRKADVPGFFVFAVVGGAVFFGSFQLAVAAGGAALASILLYTAPAWVVAAGAIWLGERITRTKVIAVAITLLGVALIAGGSGGAAFSAAAIVWGLVSGISYASYYIFGKLYFRRYSPASVYAFVFPVAALALLPFVTFSPKSGAAIAALLVIGVVSTYLAFLVYAAGLRRLEASRASVIATSEPVIAGILAHVWWGERFGAMGYVGAVLILVAVLVMTLSGRGVTRQVRGPGSAAPADRGSARAQP